MIDVVHRAGDLPGHRVGETIGEGVAVLRGNDFVVCAGVPGDSPLWTRSHRELSTEDHRDARLRAVALTLSLQRDGVSGPAGVSTKAKSTGGSRRAGYERLSLRQITSSADFPPAVR